MKSLYLIAEIAGQRVALPSGSVDSVVHVSRTVPVPLAPPHITGLAALRSRVVTMIDCRTALGLSPPQDRPIRITVVVHVDGHHYGLIVDQVEDVCEIAGTPTVIRVPLGGGWSRAACGMLDHDGASLLVVDPAGLIAGPAQAAA